ncbi:putative feruloyl esterase B precursor [Lineolata rhizophorae]|uniref:Carboxylic ester hydrolase n=1 Tax=Lineolata rhizophorae TaxID=578093 RepID=A0A6A6PDL7_9PEZI|nr:putative feruloyl esterase B precursor [Lineolata rhizophorae]
MALLICFALLILAFFRQIAFGQWDEFLVECGSSEPIHIPSDDFNAYIVSSTHVPANGLNEGGKWNTYPFCQVWAYIEYGSGDVVNFQLWLPDAEFYNGKYTAVGNGGMAGYISVWDMMTPLNSGFAVAGGDSGHKSSDNNGGSGAPGVYLPYLHDLDQTLAWIHNSIAIFTEAATFMISEYYAQEILYKYYVGCSTGGAQGFALAQYHPDLFDGIVAGCPGNWYSHLALSFLWNYQQASKLNAFMNQETLNFITTKAVEACDTIDGVQDGVIENPLNCDFDIEDLRCPPGVTVIPDAPDNSTVPSSSNSSGVACLSDAQVEATKGIYAGPLDLRSGFNTYPGFDIGSETQWLSQEGDLAKGFSIPILQNLVYRDLTYDASEFDWGNNIGDLDINAGLLIDAISPNLTEFRDAGGKMIVFQGWTDPYNAATWPIEHLEQIESHTGDTSSFFKLFMIPGGGHCGAASGYPQVPANYQTGVRLRDWVESGVEPQFVVSTSPPDGSVRTRMLCPWPKVAVYQGGDSESWESYSCGDWLHNGQYW